MLDDRINALKKAIIEYATVVQAAVEKSVRGLIERDGALLEKVMRIDEARANRYEIEIDEMCTTLIATQQPKATDLRTILMILKINSDLERIADHAVNIAQSARELIARPPGKPLIDIPRMADAVVSMISDAIKSFIDSDPVMAKKICERDSIIDALRDQIIRELITHMISDPSKIERSLHLLNVSKNLERIADLSTNIGEDVIFLVEARVIKHHHLE